jgi:hypothetical protein
MDSISNAAAAHSRATLITAVTIVFLTTAWLAVLARTWVRVIMIRNYGWDDAVMLLALVSSLHSSRACVLLADATRSPAHIHDLRRFQPAARLMGVWQLTYPYTGPSICIPSRFGTSIAQSILSTTLCPRFGASSLLQLRVGLITATLRTCS